MSARDTIAALRDGREVSPQELRSFVAGLADGTISDAQAGAFAMAVLLMGMREEGRTALTLAMRDSGEVLRWDMSDGPIIDKHSTGGIGDCVSLVLAPALAACGAYVPMVSGRGLGHTGGTLDKLEAIPGLRTDLDIGQFRQVVAQAGCAIVGATAQIAPADKRLYAVRDVTATVQSLDLITASILSKKLAAGIDGLVLDVKTGSGAILADITKARALAQALVSTARAAGCRCSALLTDMSQPLAPALGNALEVAEVMRVLTGRAGGPLLELSAALGGLALCDAGLTTSVEEGTARIEQVIASGAAAERLGRMIAAMGGPVQFVEHWTRFLPEATVIHEVAAPHGGYISAMDGAALGRVVIALGGGRQVETDRIDPAVGISDVVPLGTRVEAGQPLLRVHASRVDHADAAAAAVLAAIDITSDTPVLPPLIHESLR